MNINIFLTLIILLLYFISGLIYKNCDDKKNKLFLRLSFILLFIVLFCRKPISDLVEYIKIFRFFKGDFSNISATRFGFLYKLLNIIVGKIWFNDKFFIFIGDLIAIIGPYFFIKKYSKNYLLSILLFISIGHFSMLFYVTRQAMAISILLLSVKYIEEKKFLKFLFIVIIASLFHNSAIGFLLLYMINFIKLDKKTMYIYFSLLIFVFIFRNSISHIIINIINYYSYYIGSKFDINNEGGWLLFAYSCISIFCLTLPKEQDDKITKIMEGSMLLTLLFQILVLGFVVFSRFTVYFAIFLYILPVNLIDNLEDKRKKKFYTIGIIILILIFQLLTTPIKGYQLFFK